MSRCGNDRRKGCGREIDWGVTPEGKRVPLSRGFPIYEVEGYDRDSNTYSVRLVEKGTHRVGHHATCPEVENFRRPTPPKPDARARAAGDDSTSEG